MSMMQELGWLRQALSVKSEANKDLEVERLGDEAGLKFRGR